MNHRTSPSTEYLLQHPVRWMSLLHEKPESFWWKRGAAMALELFSDMKKRVPAYRSLTGPMGSGSLPAAHFARIPIIEKRSYLQKHTLRDVSWDGKLIEHPLTISATSGSTGEPFYFPRTLKQDEQYAAIAEMYLRNNFEIHKKSTLYIIGWGLGVWIGGIFSFAAVRILAERGHYPLSVITTGISEDEILKAVQTLGPMYDQVIIGGYPPMIKNLIDEGLRRRVKWEKYRVKFIFSAEGFSEPFRDYIASHAGLENIYCDTLNHYGTVDLGTMAHETPLSILIRRIAVDHPDINEALFGHPYRQPTLAQYIPELYFFEEEKGTLLCSARSGLPLVRYNLLDSGGVIRFEAMNAALRTHGVDIDMEMKKAGIATHTWNLPFVYVFERSDFTVKFNGANIFPQEIRRALEHDAIAQSVTGKFTMQVEYDTNVNQQLTIVIELHAKTPARASLASAITECIVSELLDHNSEFANNYRGMGKEKNTPVVRLSAYGQAPYFSGTGKHRWVRKSGQ